MGRGTPRQIVAAWIDGRFEPIASPALLDELRDVLARPRFRRWISDAATDFIDGLAQDAQIVDDPSTRPTGLSPDPDDDYLIARPAPPRRTTWSPATATCSTSPIPSRRCSRHGGFLDLLGA